MPAQLLNVTEAATHQVPPPEELKLGLEALMAQQFSVRPESTDTAIFGDTFTDPIPQPDGSNQSKRCFQRVDEF